MKAIPITALGLAAICLSGCNTLSPFAVNTKASPEVQKAQAEAKADFDRRLGERLDHCTITGQLGAGVGGAAGTGTGLTTSGSFNCPAKPWDNVSPDAPSPVPKP